MAADLNNEKLIARYLFGELSEEQQVEIDRAPEQLRLHQDHVHGRQLRRTAHRHRRQPGHEGLDLTLLVRRHDKRCER